MAVMEVACRFTRRQDMDEKWKEYPRSGIATYIIVQREETEESAKRKVVADSTEPFRRQRVEKKIENARENAEPQKCRQKGRKTCLPDFYYRPVFRGNAVVDCAVPREINWTTREMLSHRGLSRKTKQLEKQE